MGYLFCYFFSRIGMKFGVDANFRSVIFLQNNTQCFNVTEKILTVSMLICVKHIWGIKDYCWKRTSPLEKLAKQIETQLPIPSKIFITILVPLNG